MANLKSQIKRIRTSERQRQRNKQIKSALRTNISCFYEATDAKNKTAAKEALVVVLKQLDKAVSKRVIHKNNAANKKSKMARAYNLLIAEKPSKAAPKEKAPPKKSKPAKTASPAASKKKTIKTKVKKTAHASKTKAKKKK